MNRLPVHMATAAFAVAASFPALCHAMPILLFTAPEAGSGAPSDLRFTIAEEPGTPGETSPAGAAAESVVWLLVTGAAGIAAFARRAFR